MVIAFILWILVNVLDIFISLMAVKWGATEIGFLYQVLGSMAVLVVVKVVLALIIGGILAYKKKENILAILVLGLAAICIYNGCVLIKALQIIQAAGL